MGIESRVEGLDVFWLGSQAFLANSVFVLGRNLGPVLFMHSCGADALTSALFFSGGSIIFVSPLCSRLSKGVRAATVNLWLLYSAHSRSSYSPRPSSSPSFRPYQWMMMRQTQITAQAITSLSSIRDHIVVTQKRFRGPAAYLMYVAQDLLTLLLMMQSASLAQATLNAYTAKRLLGLVQLGCSSGAIVTGLLVGPLAEQIGTEPLILVQVGILLVSLIPNAPDWQAGGAD